VDSAPPDPVHSRTRTLWLAGAAIAGVAVAVHVAELSWEYLGDSQLERHDAVVNGTADDPWQYRILSEQLLRPLVAVLDVLRVPDHESWAFVLFRWVQSVAACLLAHRWFVRLGHSYGAAMVGIGLVGFVFSTATFDSDLSFNTYMEVIFYLLAVLIVIEHRRLGWLVVLVPVAVINRETALLIPVVAVMIGGRRIWRAAFIALVLGLLAYATVRWHYGPRPLITAYGNRPGLEILQYNVRLRTILQLVVTCGLLVVLAGVGWHWAGRLERRLLMLFGSLWFVIHAAVAILAETRLLLVPIVLSLVPVAIASLDKHRAEGLSSRTIS